MNDSDVFVRIISLNYTNPKPVRDVFIPGRSSFLIQSLLPGTYDIRYRILDSGKLFRSDPIVLQEERSQSGTRYTSTTVTLYAVPQGNLKTFAISESEF